MRKLPDELRHWPTARRWLIRIAIATAVLSAIGYFSPQSAVPLMCKVYG